MFEDLPSLSPVQFFGLSAECHFLSKGQLKPDRQYLLPSSSDLLGEESFVEIYVAWNFEKIKFLVESSVPFQEVNETDFRKGDSIEIFLDTRDLKSKGITRFCHHFVFFPALCQGYFGREVTRFRNEDTHKLCHPEDLIVSTKVLSRGYVLEIEIPSQCLTGFDPIAFPRIGFTYRINRKAAPPQHFAVSSEEYNIEQHPSTWGTLKLIESER
jgi:hypothetical protein